MRGKFLISSAIVVFVVLLVLFTAVGIAEEDKMDASGQWKYILDGDSATITGYVEEPSGNLVIPDELDGYAVTGFGDWVFYECGDVTNVTIPNSVTSISDGMFANCHFLTGVSIAENVKVIGNYAFSDCIRLDSVTIPDSVTSIGDEAFGGCDSLTSVTIPDSVTSIGGGAFMYCARLTTVNLPASVTDIGEDAFSDCEELTLTVAGGSYVEQYAEENGIPYVLAGSNASNEDHEIVEEIVVEDDEEERTDASGQWTYVLEGGGAKIRRYEMEPSGDLAIPSELDGYSVTAISDEALWGYSNLTGVTIPDSVTSISEFTFVECDSLINIDVSTNNLEYGQIDGVLFDKSLKILISFPAAREGTYAIPEGVTQIKGSAFNGCKSLTGVTIPISVSFIGEDAFYECEDIILTVEEGSYAEQYAKENNISFLFASE